MWEQSLLAMNDDSVSLLHREQALLPQIPSPQFSLLSSCQSAATVLSLMTVVGPLALTLAMPLSRAASDE